MAGKLLCYGCHADKGRGPYERNFNKSKKYSIFLIKILYLPHTQ